MPSTSNCDVDLVSTIVVSGAYLLYYLRYVYLWYVSQILCMDGDMSRIILGHRDFDL